MTNPGIKSWQDDVRWYVMRAHKSEKKAEERLAGNGEMGFYMPKRYVVRVFHGVKTKRLVPVIPEMVFLRASHRQIVDFKKTNNFLQFVIWNKSTGPECLTVPDAQMEDFIRVTSNPDADTLYLRPDEVNIKEGSRVRILGGELDGMCGVFMKVKGKRNKRLVIMLDGLLAVAADVKPDLVQVID
ncbi:MAG: UpxY family transcription antiterminator [Bacteroidales bacterium]|nr:UpxY family transcription antiterminator [Bacteroidales bacterium]